MSSNILEAPTYEKPPFSWGMAVFMGLFHGIALLAPWFFSWKAVGVALVLNWMFGSLGICFGYHRLLTHRSLQVPKWLERTLATLACFAVQGGPIFWVAAHRRHHLSSEDPIKDPHSAKRGLWWSHMGWLFHPDEETWVYDTYRKYAPDLDRDPFYRWLDANYMLLQIPLGLLLYLWGGWSFVIYGVFVRNVYERHATFLINSACHKFGYRNFDCADNSRNLWWAALVTYGEGWHNNHHAHPNSAKAGIKWWEIDPTWWVIASLEKLGIAKRVNRPALEDA
jgi:sn-2 palmitoyl-lipid 9-desaturase